MRPHRVVVLDVLTKHPPPMPFVDGDDVIAAVGHENLIRRIREARR